MPFEKKQNNNKMKCILTNRDECVNADLTCDTKTPNHL